MTLRQRRDRSAFWLYLGLVSLALLSPLPLLHAQSRPADAGKTRTASIPSSPVLLDFDGLDRNRDGFIDKSEAGRVPGLSAYFERADRNKDGRLDRDELARGLALVGQK